MRQLKLCPLCDLHPYPIKDMLEDQKMVGRMIECPCGLFMYRRREWADDNHTRLETVEELDANLTARWNTRPQPAPEGEDAQMWFEAAQRQTDKLRAAEAKLAATEAELAMADAIVCGYVRPCDLGHFDNQTYDEIEGRHAARQRQKEGE